MDEKDKKIRNQKRLIVIYSIIIFLMIGSNIFYYVREETNAKQVDECLKQGKLFKYNFYNAECVDR